MLQNTKDEVVQVRIKEPMSGDWKITQASLPHTRESGDVAAWLVDVPPAGKTVLSYRVRSKSND